jgi:hypothetical protein
MNQEPEDKTTQSVDLNTVSPTGREEVKAKIAADIKGDAEVPEPLNPKGEEPDKTPPVHQTQNPKHPG